MTLGGTGLQGRVAVVTGASQGIGLGVAHALAAEGAKVAMIARREDPLRAATDAISVGPGGQVAALAADVTCPEQVAGLPARVCDAVGSASILVNNAGGVGAFAPFHEVDDASWLTTYDQNVMSAVRMTRAFLPAMRERRWGRIINICSESAIQPDAFMPEYSASKAALLNLTKSLSRAYSGEGVLVNAVAPGTIRTPLNERLVADEREFLRLNRPFATFGRSGRVEEVASPVVWLASDGASFVTGATIRVDGNSVGSVSQ